MPEALTPYVVAALVVAVGIVALALLWWIWKPVLRAERSYSGSREGTRLYEEFERRIFPVELQEYVALRAVERMRWPWPTFAPHARPFDQTFD